jgi:hypothetical protein
MDVADGDDDDYYADDQVPPDYGGFTSFYVWMSWITASSLLYFAFNNKISPVGDVLEFKPDSKYLNNLNLK